jgi:serine acetyltransferase
MLGAGTLRRVIREVRSDVTSARERDPAARGVGTVEILTGWAGVQALLAHRVAHALHEADVPVVPRGIAYARSIPRPRSAMTSSSITGPASSSARRLRSATA